MTSVGWWVNSSDPVKVVGALEDQGSPCVILAIPREGFLDISAFVSFYIDDPAVLLRIQCLQRGPGICFWNKVVVTRPLDNEELAPPPVDA